MAKSGISYAQGQWAASDSAWCDFMDGATETLFDHERVDVAKATMRVLRRCHSHMWPREHWAKARKQWKDPFGGASLPAFQVAVDDLANETGLTRQRVRTAMQKAEALGLLVKLQDARGRGEGRGAVAATFTFGCYARTAQRPKGAEGGASGKSVGEKERESVARKWGL